VLEESAKTRSPSEIFLLTPRPVLSSPRDRYVSFSAVAEVRESQAANIRTLPYVIAALVDIHARRGRRAGRARLALRRICEGGRSSASRSTCDEPYLDRQRRSRGQEYVPPDDRAG